MRFTFVLLLFSLFSYASAQIEQELPPPDSSPIALDSNAQFVLPTIVEDTPEYGIGLSIDDDNDFSVVASEPISEADIIQELNRPLNLQNYSPKVREVVEVAQQEAAKILGLVHTQTHLRLYRDRLETLEMMYKKHGDEFDDGYMGAMLYYTIVYQGHALDVLIFAVQDGKIMEEHWEKTSKPLKAYRALLEGELSVNPDAAFQRVFGNEKPIDVNIHLRYEGHSGDLNIPTNSSYHRPKIWWYIWQNGCTICQEAEVDANDIDNYLLEKVDRRK